MFYVRAAKCAGYKACGTLTNFSACAIDYNSIKTPTLQILGSDGQIVWENEKYYPDFEVVQQISAMI